MAILKCKCGQSQMGFKYLLEGTYEGECCKQSPKSKLPKIETYEDLAKKSRKDLNKIAQELGEDTSLYKNKSQLALGLFSKYFKGK